MNSKLRLAALVAVAPLALALLAACTPTVALSPAAHATDPKCAEIIVRLPQSVMDFPLRQTNAQATGAWGDPAAVILRCGVTPPPPTSDRCYTVQGVDWVIKKDGRIYTFTTYGRTPATQVVIDGKLTNDRGTEALDQLATAVGSIPQSATHKCDDVLGSNDPNATQTPSPTPSPSTTP
jgi:hypothetical protein